MKKTKIKKLRSSVGNFVSCCQWISVSFVSCHICLSVCFLTRIIFLCLWNSFFLLLLLLLSVTETLESEKKQWLSYSKGALILHLCALYYIWEFPSGYLMKTKKPLCNVIIKASEVLKQLYLVFSFFSTKHLRHECGLITMKWIERDFNRSTYIMDNCVCSFTNEPPTWKIF